MVHTLAFWFGALDLSIPHSVTMTGANYLSPKMDVPDTFQVSMSHPEKLFFTFTSMFGNNYYGEGHDYLFGTKATLIHTDSDQVHVIPQGAKAAAESSPEHGGYKEMTGLHMQNFFDCVRSRKRARLPVRARLPHLDRLPDGDRLLPPRNHRALGPDDGGDHLSQLLQCAFQGLRDGFLDRVAAEVLGDDLAVGVEQEIDGNPLDPVRLGDGVVRPVPRNTCVQGCFLSLRNLTTSGFESSRLRLSIVNFGSSPNSSWTSRR